MTPRELMRHAEIARKASYSPYSEFAVGAALLDADGRVWLGCNVENASYGLTLCAECGLVSALQAGGGGVLTAFACVDGDGNALMPCGRCRQLLWEFGGAPMLVDLGPSEAPILLSQLLPRAFGPENLV